MPIIIDNKTFILTEQYSRHVVDTKLSSLIPYPEINSATVPTPPNMQWQPDPTLEISVKFEINPINFAIISV